MHVYVALFNFISLMYYVSPPMCAYDDVQYVHLALWLLRVEQEEIVRHQPEHPWPAEKQQLA